MTADLELTPELERFALECVRSGRFASFDEVVRTGLRLLQDAEAARAAFVASLEQSRAEGLRDGLVSLRTVEAEVRAAIAAASPAAA